MDTYDDNSVKNLAAKGGGGGGGEEFSGISSIMIHSNAA
jgi:hypothetical protein